MHPKPRKNRMKPIHAYCRLAALAGAAGLLLVTSSAARAGSDGITPVPGSAPASVGTDSNKPDFWHQQYMLGDWGGTRTELENEGVTFDFNNIGDFLTDVT